MKRLKLFFACLLMAVLSIGQVWGAVYFEDTFSDVGTGSSGSMLPRDGWSGSGTTAPQYNTGVRLGASSSGATLTKAAMSNIEGTKSLKVTIYVSRYNTNANTLTVTAANGTIASATLAENVSTGSGLTDGTLTIKPSANAGVTSTTAAATWTDAYKTEFTITGASSSTTIAFSSDKRLVLGPVTIEDAPASCSNTVTITKGAETNGTYSLSATSVCGDGDGEDVTISDIAPAAGYTFDEITTSASGTVDNVNKKVTGITAATTITVKFKSLPKYTVSFNVGGSTATIDPMPETIGGAGITLPDGPTPTCSADGWEFAGWAEAAVASETTTAPTLLAAGANFKPAADCTLYAVYKKDGGSGGSATVTITPSDITGDADPYTLTHDQAAYTIQINKNGGTKPAINATAGDARVYANSTLVISNASPMTELVFNISTQGKKRLAPITASVGSIAAQASGDETVTWTGNATEVTFTVGATADYGSEGSSKAGQLDFDNISATAGSSTIYYLSAPTCAAPTCEDLGTPSVTVTNKTYNSAKLTWAAVDNADKYLVKFNGVDQDATSNLYFDATGLDAATTYTYQVKALAEEGQSDYCDGDFSAEANFTTETAPDYTLTLSENGITRIFKLAGDVLPKLDAEINLPTESEQTCDGKVLVGWSTSAVAKTDVAPAMVPNPYTLSNATDKAETLYAVYAMETINKVPGNPVVYDGIGGSAALVALPYVTASGLGSDYAASNSPYLVKFDTDGDYIQFSLDYAPTKITFGYKMIGGANTSHVIVKECATSDGDYTQVESLEISGTQNSTGTLETSATFSQKYVRMVFNKGHNVGIGAITVTGFVGEPVHSKYASACDQQYTITLANDGNGNAKFDDDATTKDLYEGATAQIIATPAAHYNFVAWTYDSEKVEVEDPNSATTTITAKATAATITATFAIKSTHNVTFKSNGSTIGEPVAVYDGETVTLLGAPAVYDANYPYFIGWSASDFKKQATAPALVTGEEAITEDVTYHAVFGNVDPTVLTNNYKKITSNLVSGNYVFATMDGKAMKAEVTEKVAAEEDVTISDDVISEPAASIIWQVTKSEENYTLYNAGAAKYMNIIADGSYGQLALEDDAQAYTAQFGATNQDIILRSATITGQLIEYYSGFKSYSHSATAIYAFQQQHATPTEWVTREVVSYPVKYYDNVDGEVIDVPADDVALDGEDYTVSTTEAVRPGYQFVGWNTDKTASVGIVKVEDVHAAIDLYAIWEANPICTIHFSVRGDVKAGMDEDVLQGKAYDGFAGKTIAAEDEVEGFTFMGWASAAQVAETTSPVVALSSLTPEIQASASEVTVFALYKRTIDNGQKTDKITADDLDATGTSYVPFSDVHKVSNAYYAGGSAYGNAAIQLRSNSSDAGVISTTSGGQIRSIVLDWETDHTDPARVITVYGKNSAYAGIAELYNSEAQGTKLGEIAVSETTLNITGDYAYVGIRSKSGALYLNQISITWQDVTNYYTTKPVTIDHLELGGEYPTAFDKGDAFSHAGMTVKAVYSDDSKVDVTSDATFSGYDMSTPGNQTVTVSYGGKSITYSITVNPPALTSIYLGGTYQTLFAYNSAFNHDGLVVMAVYSDASEVEVTSSASFSAPDMEQEGVQDVTVTYETEEAVYSIRIIPANTDIITAEGIGVEGNSYEAWTGKTGFGTSSVYAGNSTNATNPYAGALQLRYNTATEKQSGIVLTASNGLVLKGLSITVASAVENPNTLNVYAKNTAYTGYSDLYSDEEAVCGKLIGTVSTTGAMTLEAGVSYDDNYQYIGMRSANGALYLNNITITWGEPVTPPAPVYETVRSGLEIDRYYTICLSKDVTAATGATFWNLKNRNAAETEVYLEEVSLPLEAGKPYIFQAAAATLNVTYGDGTVAAPVENGALRGTFEDLNATELAAKATHVYILIQNSIRPAGGENSLKANRAYIDYDALIEGTPSAAPGKRVRALPMQPQTATGIDALNASETPVKVMIDGQLYILRGEKMYNANGQIVK